jgi:hypothetical protein
MQQTENTQLAVSEAIGWLRVRAAVSETFEFGGRSALD